VHHHHIILNFFTLLNVNNIVLHRCLRSFLILPCKNSFYIQLLVSNRRNDGMNIWKSKCSFVLQSVCEALLCKQKRTRKKVMCDEHFSRVAWCDVRTATVRVHLDRCKGREMQPSEGKLNRNCNLTKASHANLSSWEPLDLNPKKTKQSRDIVLSAFLQLSTQKHFYTELWDLTWLVCCNPNSHLFHNLAGKRIV